MPVDTRVTLTQSVFDNHIQSIHDVLVQNVKTVSDIYQLQKDLENIVQKITQLTLYLKINKIVQQLILILDVAFSGFLACNPTFTQEQVAVFLQRCIDRALDVRENPNALLTNHIIIIPDPVAAPVAVPEAVAESVAVPDPVAAPVAVPEPVAESVAVPEPVAEPVAVPEPVAEPVAVPEPVAESVAVPEPVAEPVAVPEPVTASEAVTQEPQTKKLMLKF